MANRTGLLGFGLTGLLVVLGAMPAHAQGAPWEYELDWDAVAVLAPGASDTDNPFGAETALYEFSLDGRAEKVLQNGVEIATRLTWRVQRDHPARPGGAGQFPFGDETVTAGAYSALSGAGAALDTGAFGSLETAYLEANGGYGELRVGRDRGVAFRFFEGAPGVLSHAGADSPYLDPFGLSLSRTRNDLTGPAAKVSYASPRILGLRLGASYTPEVDLRSLDRVAGRVSPEIPALEDAYEFAANLSRRLPGGGPRLQAALGWSSAEADYGALAPSQRFETVSAGLSVEFDRFEVGLSWLDSENGGADTAPYDAISLGAGLEAFDIDWSADVAFSEDDGAGLEATGFSLAARREISDMIQVALAYRNDQIENDRESYRSDGLVIEITLSGEIL